MIDLIKQGMSYYDALTKENPWMLMLVVPLITASMYWLRNLPLVICRWVARNCTTRLQMDNSGYGTNEIQFNAFMAWYMTSPWAKKSRSISMGNRSRFASNGNGILIGPGRGIHLFIHKNRLFWFEKSTLDSSGAEKQKEAIEIVTLGRSHAPLFELINIFKFEEPDNSIGIYNFGVDGWCRMAGIVRRPLESVCVEPEIKNHLLKSINRFAEQREWFYSKGLPHKLTVLLFGCPGTGKTSLVQAIASHYQRDVMVLDLSGMTNGILQKAIAQLPKGSILLLEDIDAASDAVRSRESHNTEINSSIKSDGGELNKKQSGGITGFGMSPNKEGCWGLTLSGLLNVLQGVIALDDVMVFMTTNHPEQLDPALIRAGRVDCKYQIGPMDSSLIHQYIRHMYQPQELDPTLKFRKTVGAEVQSAFYEHPHDLGAFIKKIGTEGNPQ